MALFPPPRQRSWSSRTTDFFASLRWQFILRYAVFAFVFSLALSAVLLFRRPEGFFGRSEHYYDYLWDDVSSPSTAGTPSPEGKTQPPVVKHPIEELVADGHALQEKLLAQRSKDLPTAADRYRKRRGRHPPPGFDAWMQYAVDHDAIIVESFFDRIYHDLTPYWALDHATLAERASSWHHVVRVRDGQAYPIGNTQGRVAWLQLWTTLVNESAPFLPDVDMPINYMDESRLLVPWEDIDKYVTKEHTMRSLVPREKVVKEFSGLAAVDAKRNLTESYDPEWVKSVSYWDLTRAACAPTAPSRNIPTFPDFEQLPTFSKSWNPGYSHRGYVRNFSAAIDPCIQPHLREMHGTFVEPLTMSTSRELIPLFGGSKLPGNNEILIPGAMYLTDDPFYSGGVEHGPPWNQKIDGIVWRGVGSGGRNKKENWSHFQRHRLVEMLNGSTVSGMEESHTRAPTFEMPSAQKYDFPRRRTGTIGKWLETFADAGFVNLLCFPADSNCTYVQPYLSEVESIKMVDQYKYKFMPDVDGNSFSARYRGFLLSTSLPIKATVYAEWHDDRLVPWQHFVPMDNTYQDLYGILDYFTRDKKGDDSARFIAESGRDWASKVLRREDMLLYVWRLLLEFARVCDEKREVLGYVDDLKAMTGFDDNGDV
ncbi:capsular associated protein [Seiridium cupressi]